ERHLGTRRGVARTGGGHRKRAGGCHARGGVVARCGGCALRGGSRGTPNQMACCQQVFFEVQFGSNGWRFLSTPTHSITSSRMHAPTACILGLPAATSRSKSPLRRGLNRMAVRVGRYRAARSRAFPAFDSRVYFLTDLPLVNSLGASP